MSYEDAKSIVLAFLTLLAGGFGVKLLDKWFDRSRVQMEAEGEERKLVFSDNEQARRFLQAKLTDAEDELKRLRANEITLMTQMAELGAKVARQEERSDAQAKQIEALQTTVAKWAADYLELKGERDQYRTAKHDSDNKLTAATMRAGLAEREVVALKAEIDQLKGQLAALSPRRTADGGTTP